MAQQFSPSLVDYFLEVSIADPLGTPVRAIVHRVPAYDRIGFGLPDGVRYFCIPDKLDLRYRATYERQPSFHSFTLTGGDGSRAFGFALKTYRPIADTWVPHVLCFVSHFPLVGLFKDILGSTTAWLDVVTDLVADVPGPQAGTTAEFHVHDELLFAQTVHKGGLAFVDDVCFQLLFEHLSVKNIVYILNCMLLEQRILIHSSNHGRLTPVCEALCALLFPFVWEHVYIPLLPMKLIEYLQAPVPFLMGVHTSYLTTKFGADVFASCVVIHLDKDKVVRPIHSGLGHPIGGPEHRIPKFPSAPVAALLTKVKAILDSHQPLSSTATSPYSRLPGNEHSEVELTFGPGPLGITFESTHLRLLGTGLAADGPHPSAVIKALPTLQNGLPGPAALSGLLRPGSFLLSVNGRSTLQLSFDATCELLRSESRPLRLRFQTAPKPFPNACRFAARVRASAVLSPSPPRAEGTPSPLVWVDSVRTAFAEFFLDLFRGYDRYIRMAAGPPVHQTRRLSAQHRPAVSFDRDAFLSNKAQTAFYRVFLDTQAFVAFTTESALSGHGGFKAPLVELFKAVSTLNRGDASQVHACLQRHMAPLRTNAFHLPFPRPTPRAEGRRPMATAIHVDNDTADVVAVETVALLVETPAKRASATRQLEMMICGATRDPEACAVAARKSPRRRRSLSESSIAELEDELGNQADGDRGDAEAASRFTKSPWVQWKPKIFK
ncbi:hypothetical protein ACHHYP_02410 [Achlya hypogyna]|uniref:UDENN domain-containing protein n=1 Tax=Achlya hypogyna TaxID=1202772 RepID=A0A1V9Z6X0_ACHHY|nr:hypothetical protein ACHHYP_02410 [Achlya hypogyna]